MADYQTPDTASLAERSSIAQSNAAGEAAKPVEYNTSAAGLGSLAKKLAKAKSPMPKQSDYPGDNAGWTNAVRQWRTEQSEDPESVGQKKALGRMK